MVRVVIFNTPPGCFGRRRRRKACAVCGTVGNIESVGAQPRVSTKKIERSDTSSSSFIVIHPPPFLIYIYIY
jgi:hypothetical protein